MNDETKVTVKWDYDAAWGGFLVGISIIGFSVALVLLNVIGFERDIFEYFGKLGALVEDGYNHQREIPND